MADTDTCGHDDFYARMDDAPAHALAVVMLIEHHFQQQANVTVYYRRVPDLRLAANWMHSSGRKRQQVFATIQWQQRKLSLRIGAFVLPDIWKDLGFHGAKLFKNDPLISYIIIPEDDWLNKFDELLAVLDAAKVALLDKKQPQIFG